MVMIPPGVLELPPCSGVTTLLSSLAWAPWRALPHGQWEQRPCSDLRLVCCSRSACTCVPVLGRGSPCVRSANTGLSRPLQVDTLCLEDLHAFIAQALCLQGKSAVQLVDLQVLTRLSQSWGQLGPMEGQRSDSLCMF